MDRRDFVKNSCTMCLALGTGMLASCGSAVPLYKTTIANNRISVPVSTFAQTDFQLISPEKFAYNIGLRKENDGTYTALLLRCTHHDNQLITTGNGYRCTLHGSQFNKEGQVTNGPAERSLKKYPTQVVDNQIIIQIT
ncbi:Rieske (2Fe-2S) protein [Mucilaginibacter corticis]|uniref:Rieske (2Fe-2S) protein n=1 Tax=Mucilaginibacter corticis TaxID=2597670 RepID=A0A556MBI3_9SPHI|nr:Rieske (2Fe-2S) protein [Mucilaginibacter corticis]TSJ37232.1 Rieske (2Fe-2S) protein [Mucilaginibacter corticis]